MEHVAGSHNPYPVTPTGFLIGSYLAFLLYGLHLTQLYTYFSTYSDPIRTKLLVLWIFLLSTLQMAIIVGSGWKYFVGGIDRPDIWGEFLWPLSFQDGLIPMMAFTGQLYFGRRAWIVLGKRKWVGILVILMASVTLACGIALAITARLWADYPFVSAIQWAATTENIGVPSQIVAITWMGLSAFTDGSITLILIFRFRPHAESSPRIVARLIRLTLETVLLTHICGATMCVIFLASDAKHRTDKDIFWVLIEIITELYALSILFTINARRSIRKGSSGGTIATIEGSSKDEPAESMCVGFGTIDVERRVEGYQGDTPFGVSISPLLLREGAYHPHRAGASSSMGQGSSSGFVGSSGSGEMLSLRSIGGTSVQSPWELGTPGDELNFGHFGPLGAVEQEEEIVKDS